MQFDQYNLYSFMAGEHDDKEGLQKVLSYVEDFSNIATIEEAKEYLEKMFNIKDLVSNYPLGANSYLAIKSSDKHFAVSFSFLDENKIFSFTK